MLLLTQSQNTLIYMQIYDSVRKQTNRTDGSNICLKNSKLHLTVISSLVFTFLISQRTHSFLSLGNKAAVLAVHKQFAVCVYIC